MWKEWLPNCREYKLVGNYNIEMYAPPCSENTGESYAEIYFFGQGTQVRVSGILESVDDDEYMRIKTYIKGDG